MAGLQIPGALADLLNMLGYTWPKSDEVKMFELGQKWLEFGGKVQSLHGAATPHGTQVLTANQGLEIEAFRTRWEDEHAAPKVTKDGGTAGMVIGAGLFVAAALVLALKIAVIVQLTILAIQIAQAIATAVATFGASLLEIPIFKKLADLALDLIIDQVLNVILG